VCLGLMSAADELGHRVSPACSGRPGTAIGRWDCTNSALLAARSGAGWSRHVQDVYGYPGEPLAAPALPAVPLKPR